MSKSQDWRTPDEIDLDDALGQAIGEAMQPERCKEKDFAQGVRERMAEAKGDTRKLSAFARSAAAFLPPALLPKGLIKGGVVLGGVGVKKAGWKLVPSILAFPALVLVMLTVTFVVCLRRSVVRGPQKRERTDAQSEVAAWWRKFFVPVSLSVLALVWFGLRAPLEAVMLFVVLSMMSLVGILGVLARAGLATRREVGYRASSFLFGLVVWAQFFPIIAERGDHAQYWPYGVPVTLIGGGVFCTMLGVWDDATGKETWKAWLVLVFGGIFAALFGGLGHLVASGSTPKTPVTRGEALEYLEGGFRPVKKMAWEVSTLTSLAVNLRADGGEAPDLQVFQQELSSWIDTSQEERGGKGVNPLYLTEPESLGLWRATDYLDQADAYRQGRLLTRSTPFKSIRQAASQIAVRAHGQPLTGMERDFLAQRVLQGVKSVGSHGVLRDLYLRWMVLNALERPEAAERLAESVRENLLATYAPESSGGQACFAPGASSLLPSERIENPLESLTFVWMGATDYGVRLMDIYGVPDPIDLKKINSYLTELGQRHAFAKLRGVQAEPVAIRSRLQTLPGWKAVPEDDLSPIHHLLRLRLLMTGLALSLFCVFVTLRTPKTPQSE